MLIEFAVAYWDPGWPSGITKIEAHIQSDAVRVIAVDAATMSPAEWDDRRLRVASSGQPEWPAVYKGTPIEAAAARVDAQALMAFGELHVLAPDSTTAGAMSVAPGLIVSRFGRGVVTDGMGNPLRLLHHPLAPHELTAAIALMRKAMLHRLDVVSSRANGNTFRFETYFAPFHMPGVATSELTPDEIALKDSLPT